MTQAYPLQWPAGWPRTPPERRETGKFKTTLSGALSNLQSELRLLGGKNLVLSSNVTLGEQRPSDPGIAAYFTYDGDQSGRLNPDIPVDAVPDGSAGIERTLSGYLNSAGVRPADMPLSRFTDYYAFLRSGIPVGGLTAGANQLKTEAQARLWGGRPGLPFDPNDHTPRDGIDNIDRDALTVLTRAAAFTVGTYAYSIDGVNGVPARDQRQRTAP